MNRNIRKVAILGSGVMGSRIACHFANIGCEVVLLDIQPKELNDKELAIGLTSDSPIFKNRIVNDALQFALKTNPSPIYSKRFISRIITKQPYQLKFHILFEKILLEIKVLHTGTLI